MKRIKILTFHYAHNYGAVLQAYALKEFLTQNGFCVEIVNYQNKYIAENYKKRLEYEYKISDLRNINQYPQIIKSFFQTQYMKKDWKKKYNRFNCFIDNILLEGKKQIIKYEDLSQIPADFFIAGSDQIWSSNLTGGLDKGYFLDFDTKASKIFYAASNGRSTVADEDVSYYTNVLKNKYVSTREKELADSIKKRCHIDAVNTVDPTLLLDRKQYDQLITGTTKIKKPYVFAYFVGEDKRMQEIAEYLARALNIELRELHYFKNKKLKGHQQGTDFGPIDFLNHIKDAELIVTNSFHGTVFSIIYEKLFYCTYFVDDRKDNLLRVLGLEERHIYQKYDADLNATINYRVVNEKKDKIISQSKEFLLDILSR